MPPAPLAVPGPPNSFHSGTGAFSHVSLRHKPDVFNSPLMFAAIGVKGHPELARVLEAPVPEWKLFGGPGTANGAGGTSYGLPRLASGTFLARFPFAMAVMRDRRPPLEVTLTGWSPFEPNDPDGASLPPRRWKDASLPKPLQVNAKCARLAPSGYPNG